MGSVDFSRHLNAGGKQYCNDLEEGMNGGDFSKKSLEIALMFLERYAIGHFGQEETCMPLS